MDLTSVRKIALMNGIRDTQSQSLTSLIRGIQNHEGFWPCFRTDDSSRCQRAECRWRTNCIFPPTMVPAAHVFEVV